MAILAYLGGFGGLFGPVLCGSEAILAYRIIPNRSTGCLDKNPGGGYIRFREPGTTATNMTYKRNRPSKLGGASIRRGAFIGDNTVFRGVQRPFLGLFWGVRRLFCPI